MRNSSLWSNVVFEKEVNWILSKILKDFRPEAFFRHLKTQLFGQQGLFIFDCSLATSMANWVQISKHLLFYAYVWIHKRQILVFDNYKKCPVPLKGKYTFGLNFKLASFVDRRSNYFVTESCKKETNLPPMTQMKLCFVLQSVLSHVWASLIRTHPSPLLELGSFLPQFW